jgi:DNA-binding CsgD family transcriptional regulator
MKADNINIFIIDPSYIVYEGLVNTINKAGNQYNFYLVDSLNELQQQHLLKRADIIIINPALIQNQIKAFHILKKELINSNWIGFVYSLFEQKLLSLFDMIIYINDTPNSIINKIQKLPNINQSPKSEQIHDFLTDREIDVLKLLVAGHSNKEIADKLNISTNTVISHRKNISQKTSIKSVSGLTIYAVVNNIITIDNYQE